MSKSVYCVLGTHKAFTSKQEACAYAALIGTQVFGFDVNSNATEVWLGACWSDRDGAEYHFQAPEGRGDCYYIIQ